MTTIVRFPGGVAIRAAGQLDQHHAGRPVWGVYADPCWTGWPGIVLAWPDFGVPSDAAQATRAMVEAFGRAREGQDVLVGCRGGAGRTGTILACLAVLAGVPPELAVKWVRGHYRPDAVEKDAQQEWVLGTFAPREQVNRVARRSRLEFIEGSEGRLREAMRLDGSRPGISSRESQLPSLPEWISRCLHTLKVMRHCRRVARRAFPWSSVHFPGPEDPIPCPLVPPRIMPCGANFWGQLPGYLSARGASAFARDGYRRRGAVPGGRRRVGWPRAAPRNRGRALAATRKQAECASGGAGRGGGRFRPPDRQDVARRDGLGAIGLSRRNGYVYAYLRWNAGGRTVSKYLGAVSANSLSEGLLAAWADAEARGFTP